MSRTASSFLILAILVGASAAQADGMYVAPEGMYIYEPVQQAYIDWNAEAGTEALSILPFFYGDATGFAWVVPVPGLPEVTAGDRRVFDILSSITQPEYRYRDGQWDCFHEEDYAIAAGEADNGVDIISSDLVGYYQTMVLSSDNASALLDSLTNWGFLHEGNIERATAAITDYVERSWYFVTMQVDSTALAAIYGEPGFGYYYPYYYGGLEPVTMTFPTEEPVFPMKISAVSAADETRVDIYIKSDHRMTFPGAETYYANLYTSSELASIPWYPDLQEWLQPGDYLTRLRRNYSPAQMSADLVLVRASTDQEFRLINYSGWPITTLLRFGPPAVWGVLRASRKRR